MSGLTVRRPSAIVREARGARREARGGGGPEDGLFAVDRIPSPPNTPKARAAGWRFSVPAGLTITRLTTQHYLGQRSAGEWFPYLKTAEGAVLDTCEIPGGEDRCQRGEPAYDPFGPVATFTTSTTGLEGGVRCTATAGSCGNGVFVHAAWVALCSARVQITDSTAPSLSPQSGPVWTGGYLRGTREATPAANDTTGIRRTLVLIDGVERAAASARATTPTSSRARTSRGRHSRSTRGR
jgi:hypothetical protein